MGRTHLDSDRSAKLWRDIRRKSRGTMSRGNLKATMETRNKKLDTQTGIEYDKGVIRSATAVPEDTHKSAPEDKTD